MTESANGVVKFTATMPVKFGRGPSGRDDLRQIPFYLLEPYRLAFERNHGQSLERLAERGGVDSSELAWAMTNTHAADEKGRRVPFRHGRVLALTMLLQCIAERES